jgi:hypothetical protein
MRFTLWKTVIGTFFFLSGSTGAWTHGLTVASRHLPLEPLTSPFFVLGFFQNRVLWTICPGLASNYGPPDLQDDRHERAPACPHATQQQFSTICYSFLCIYTVYLLNRSLEDYQCLFQSTHDNNSSILLLLACFLAHFLSILRPSPWPGQPAR